jgi:hypothetical protein
MLPSLRSSFRGAAAPSRALSAFAYVTPGKVVPRQHEMVFDEAQRKEVWKSDGLPCVPLSLPSSSPSQSSSSSSAPSPAARLQELRAAHPSTFLVHYYREELVRRYGAECLSGADAAPLLAPLSTEEEALVATAGAGAAGGRLVEAAQAARAALHRASALAEADEADGALQTLPLSPAARASVRGTLYRGVAAATLRMVRAATLAHLARARALPAHEAAREEAAWVAAMGVHPSSAASARSPRIPSELYATRDRPLETPLTQEERRNDTHVLDRPASLRLAMEHRDRAELLSRRQLPKPLHADAPSDELAQAALALDQNRSLSQPDKEYMLRLYASALNQTPDQMADETRLVDDAEKKAWSDPQPQWGVYDPSLPILQDDLHESIAGRGKFSRFRGYAYRQAQVPPSTYGESTLPGVAPGTPLETLEEAALSARQADERARAEGDATTAAVTAALARAMGLPVRGGGNAAGGAGGAGAARGKAPGAGSSFFRRLAAGEAAPVVSPPATGNRITLARIEEGSIGGNKGSKGGAKGAAAGGKGAPAKGGKPAPAAAKKK